MQKLRWGVLSTAKIGLEKVIPAMQKSHYCDIAGLASRSLEHAQQAADKLGIAKAYGSYQALLADPAIDAVYNPLPNHLHVPLTVQALQAGKHVLCEKPIALSSEEAQTLLKIAAEYPQLKVMEAFMYRFHPQWQAAKKLVQDGEVGELKTLQTFFSYFNADPANIRNQADIGGGGLMDIGCYPISQARFMIDAEPQRVFGLIEHDPQFQTDRIASAILDFGSTTATFTCSTQLNPFQRAQIVGTEGRIEIEIPVNAPADKPCRLWHQRGVELREISFDSCDQYALQGDAFSRAVLDNTAVPTPLQDAVANMHVIDAIISSHQQGRWVKLA